MTPKRTNDLNRQQEDVYKRYKHIEIKLFGEEAIYPNTHFSLHYSEALNDYGPLKQIDCESDEVCLFIFLLYFFFFFNLNVYLSRLKPVYQFTQESFLGILERIHCLLVVGHTKGVGAPA